MIRCWDFVEFISHKVGLLVNKENYLIVLEYIGSIYYHAPDILREDTASLLGLTPLESAILNEIGLIEFITKECAVGLGQVYGTSSYQGMLICKIGFLKWYFQAIHAVEWGSFKSLTVIDTVEIGQLNCNWAHVFEVELVESLWSGKLGIIDLYIARSLKSW